MPNSNYFNSHPLVRLRKYIRHRKYIRNTLYRRFTLSNRGYTPLSFKTKYLNFALEENKALYFYRSIYSRRLGRIYHINGKDWRLDFSSCRAPEEIISLSKSLDPTNICAVYCEDLGNDFYKNHYIYPFKKTKGEGYITEESDHFYPGLYYCSGVWLWTDSISDYLYELEGRAFTHNRTIRTTDYTYGDDRYIPYQALLDMYLIYIPYDSIKTTAVQAYLPLSKNPIYLSNLYKENTSDRVYFTTSTIFWMGRPIQLFGWEEPQDTGRIYMNRTLQPYSTTGHFDIIKRRLIAAIYHNSIPIDSTFHHLARRNFF